MSWDAIICNLGRKRADTESLKDACEPVSLGTLEAVCGRVSRDFGDVEWSNGLAGRRGYYRGDGFSIEFGIEDKGPVLTIGLNVRGGGDALQLIMQFASSAGWSVFDSQIGEFLDPTNPSQAS